MPIDPDFTLSTQSILILLGMIGTLMLLIATSWAVVVERLLRKVPIIPERPGRPVPWRGVQVLACAAIWQVSMFAVALVLRSRRGADDEPDIVAAFAALSLINLALTIGLPLLLAAWNGASAEDFGLVKGRIGQDSLIGFLAALFCLPLVYAVQFMAIMIWPPTAHPLQEMLLLQQDPAILLLALGSAVVFAPAAEELIFRGIFQGWLDSRFGTSRLGPEDARGPALGDSPGHVPGPDHDPTREPLDNPYAAPEPPPGPPLTSSSASVRRWGNRLSLIVPAFIFAAVHAGQWPAPIPLFLLALGLGLVYRRTKGLIAPIAMHATFNGVSTVAMIVIVLIVPMADPDELPGPTEPPVPPVAGASADREENPPDVPGGPSPSRAPESVGPADKAS